METDQKGGRLLYSLLRDPKSKTCIVVVVVVEYPQTTIATTTTCKAVWSVPLQAMQSKQMSESLFHGDETRRRGAEPQRDRLHRGAV